MFCNITEEIENKCTLFAETSEPYSSDRYEERGQFNKEQKKLNIKNGKIAEEVVYEILFERFPDLSKPDYTILHARDKSWIHDLHTNNIRLSVKSCDFPREKSWVFQYNYGKDYDCDLSIFKHIDPNHCVVFVSLDNRLGRIEAIVKVQWLHDKNLFDHMRSPSLDGMKKAVYYDSPSFNNLKNYPDELWQL